MIDPTIKRAAGVLLVAANGQALFLRRSLHGDMPGTWCLPFGGIEEGETPEEAARREFRQETGVDFNGKLALLIRNVMALPQPIIENGAVPPLPVKVDATTFISKGGDTFEPKLNDEHVGYCWAPLDAAPEPLHPGVRIALERMTMDELAIAEAIRDGRLSSPQRYMNMTLVALRITGTGTSYRSRDNEFVYRRPENYLNQRFLDRCNGLQVILDHPKTRTLNSKEFDARSVGAVMMAYIQGDEVWGIAKIYDDATVLMIDEDRLSTSPCVVFRELDDNTSMRMDDGAKLLIEGKPSLLDHLAICERGVWDNGEEPSGIRVDSATTEKVMTDEEKAALAAKEKADAEAKAKADAEGMDNGAKLDKLLSCMDSFGSRMDSVSARLDSFEAKEKEKADAEAKAKADAEKSEDEKKADAEKAKADAEAKEKADAEAKEKADAEAKAKADSAVSARIDAIEKKLPRVMTDADIEAMANAQAKADSVYQAHGLKAGRPLDGESLLDYRRRLVGGLKQHSPSWKDANLVAIADSATFDNIEKQVYADSMQAALIPADLPAGQLRKIVVTDAETGLRQIQFRGSQSFIHGMKRPARRVLALNANRARAS